MPDSAGEQDNPSKTISSRESISSLKKTAFHTAYILEYIISTPPYPRISSSAIPLIASSPSRNFLVNISRTLQFHHFPQSKIPFSPKPFIAKRFFEKYHRPESGAPKLNEPSSKREVGSSRFLGRVLGPRIVADRLCVRSTLYEGV